MKTSTLSKWTITWIFAMLAWMLAVVAYGQNWRPATTIDASKDFYGVDFTSDQVGYAVGTSGAIYKTVDGGLSWSAQASNTTETLYDVDFLADATTGYAVGANGTIRKTINAGVTWTTITVSGTSTTTFRDVHFRNANNGYIAGSGGTVIKTTNAGTNWTSLTTGTSSDINGMYFSSIAVGYIVANNGLIRKTADGGSNWSTLTIATTENLNDVYFLSDDLTGYVCGTNGEVWQTLDAGVNWTSKKQGIGSLELYSIQFADASIGNASSFGGWHWATTDAAEHWISYNTSGSPGFYDTEFASTNTGYMVGTQGTVKKYQSELEPEVQPTDLVFSEVYSTTLRVSFSESLDLPTGYIAVRKVGSAPTTNPMDGITYSEGAALGDGTVVYIGASAYFSQSGLSPGTTYYYNIYAYNGSSSAINYNHSSPLAGSRATYAQGTPWSVLYSPGGLFFPEDLHYYDANTGGTAGGYTLLATADGGQTWNNGFLGNGDGYSGVFFASPSIGFVVGNNSGIRVIRRTVNGGATWVDQVRTSSSWAFNDVWFTSTITGAAVGGEGKIYRTVNGISWSAASTPTSNELNGVHFPTSTAGFAVGSSGTLIKSSDGGANWGLSPASGIVTTETLRGVFFTTLLKGYAVGDGGVILKTTDGGFAWSTLTSGTTNNLYAVHFVDESTGYVAGMGGTLLKTTNGGTDWYAFTEGISGTPDFYAIFFPTAYTGYAAGYDGSVYNLYKFQSVPQPVSQPENLTFSAYASSGFNVSFTAPANAVDGYLVVRGAGSPPTGTPLDGVSYTAGTTLGDGVVAYSGSSTSFSETTLTAGTQYYYRVFAYNNASASGSLNYVTQSPLEGDTYTLLLPPTAASASSFTSSGFTANWSAVSGAAEYRLDVSIDGFSTFVAGYNNLFVGTTSKVITGLSPGTTYSYRVRAINESGASANSNSIAALTIPAAPVASAASLISTIGLTANWASSVGATSYLFDLSSNNFSTYISSYHDFALTATQLSITGLTAGTTYQYRVRAVNATGTSTYSSTITTPLICDPPGATTASAISGSGFTANWSPSAGAADYRMDLATDPSFNLIVGSFSNFTVTGSSKVVTGLSTGTTYYYRLRAANTSGSSANSSVISVLTLPTAPVATDATSIGSATFVANWGAVPTATGYRLDVSTSSGFSSFVSGYQNAAVSSTSTTVTVPTEGLTYYSRVRAENATGTSNASSNVITTLLKPATPVASAASAVAATSFTATWAAASGASGYTLEVSSDNFVSNEPNYDNVSISGTSTSVTDLLEGLTYKYRVRAVNAQWSSGTSNTITVTTIPPSPTALSATSVATTSLTAKWAATAGATSYRLDVSQDNFASTLAGYSNLTVAGTSTSVTGLSAGLTYQYRVRAVNAAGTSGNSNVIATSTLTVAPVANSSTSISSSGFTANWNSVAGATDYRIDVASGNTFGSFEGIYNSLTVSSTSVAVTGLSAGSTYYYRVRANNASGASANSNVITTLLKPAAPNATSASGVTTTSLTANWDAVPAATGYKLDVSANDFISNLAGYDNLSVSGNSQEITGLTPGGTYKYRVRSQNATGFSDNSNNVAAITVPPAPSATAATQVTTTGFTATWNTSSSVPAYYLDVSTSNTFSTFLPGFENFPSSTGSQSITGLTEGATYYYRVRGANISGTSTNSSLIQVATLPLGPVADPASAITASGFTASWSSVNGASDYRIDVSTDIGFSFYVGSYFNQQVAGTLLPISGLSPGTVYYYRVRAVNTSGSSTNSQSISALTLPGPPVAFDALSVTGTTLLANWGSVSTATSYRLDVSTASNFSTFVTGYEDLTVNSTSTQVTLPVGGTTYYYRVRAVSSAGTSANSNSITTLLKPAPPVISAASAVTAEGFTAGWLASPGATGYYLDISANNFASFISPYENFLLPGTSLTVSGLIAGTNYQYRVRSYNAAGASSSSAVMTTVTIPPAPVTVQSTAFTTTSFTANWQAATGATSYKVDVSTDFDFGANTFVTGFQDLEVSGTFINITNLQAGTVYYYRVRAVNASGTSPNSNVTSSTNVPPPPTGLLAGSITTNGMSINWTAAPGALNYALDVSSTHFASFVNAYNNLSVTGTTLNLVGLTAGTTYQIRVRAVNASGTSLNSAVLSAQTLPDEPAAQPSGILFTEITTTSLKITYTPPAGGASGYLVLRKTVSAPTGSPGDALTYNLGTALGDAIIAYVGSAETFSDGGLTAGEKYFYSIFAYNGAGANTNYLTTSPVLASQVTVSPAPALLAASAVGQTSFTANWTPAKGAEDYLVDVSSDDFNTFVTGHQNQLTGNVSSFALTGLTGGVTYQYRLRAKNSGGVSANSSTQSVLTIPPTPVGLTASAVTATSFEVSWTAVASATSYYVDLSTDENFSILIVNNGTTTEPQVTFSGLGNSTKYYVRARSANASGSSPSSTVLSATTLAGGSGPAALTIGNANFASTIKSSPVTVTVSVTGGADPKTVKLRHRKLTVTAFSELAVALKSGSVYETTIMPEMADELGVEFYFVATDANGTSDESETHYFIHQAIDASSNKAVPFALESFDGKAATYQMFSIPYELADNNIANVFEPALNGFSNTRWRLLRYAGGEYIEYPDQLKKIELGQGYWFNTIQTDFEIKLGAAVADLATTQSPFEIVLEQGWNQIGDPYPFNVEWSAVQNANPAAGLSSFWHFEEGGFTKKTVLQTWKAGFVFSENGGTITFPLSSRTTSTGRVQSEPELDPSAGEWHLPMLIHSDDIRSNFAVGMRRDARAIKDRYDEIAIPHFLDYLDVTTHHPEFFAPHFAADVVQVAEAHTWEFSVRTNMKNRPATISWDSQALGTVEGAILLFDPTSQMLVNMKNANRYEFKPQDGQVLKVILTPGLLDDFETISLGVGYPNPFVNSLRIPLYVETENSRVNVQIYTALGLQVQSIDAHYRDAGYYELEWQANPTDASVPSEGLLLYRVTVNGIPSTLKRVIKANR